MEEVIPAPSMAEVWRELPSEIEHKEPTALFITKSLLGDNRTFCCYVIIGTYYVVRGSVFISTNPTDALVDLLIWVRKEEK